MPETWWFLKKKIVVKNSEVTKELKFLIPACGFFVWFWKKEDISKKSLSYKFLIPKIFWFWNIKKISDIIVLNSINLKLLKSLNF